MVGLVVFFIAFLQISQGIDEPENDWKFESNSTTTTTTTTVPITTVITTTTTTTVPTTTASPTTIRTTTTTAKSISTESATEELVKTTSTVSPSSEPTNWKPVPENTYVVRDDGKICLLAKFHATFSISYTSRRGTLTPVVVKIPRKGVSREGRCGSESQNPVLTIYWAEFRYSISFSKHPYRDKDGEYWGIKSMEFSYDSRLKLFDGAEDAGKKTVHSINKKEGLWLQTEVGKSYHCPAAETIFLYNDKNEKKVSVNLTDVHIQAYNVVDGNFSPAELCEEVSVGSQRVETFRDETAPMAVGSTFAILTLLAVIGFAVYRSVTAKRVDYSTME